MLFLLDLITNGMTIRNVVLFFLLMAVGNVFGQATKVIPDTVIKMGGRKFPAFIKTVGSNFIIFSFESKPDSIIKAQRKDLEKIIYKNGRIEIFSKPAVQMIQEGQWESILVTRKEKDVSGLYKRAFITAKSTGSARSKKAAQETATIRLQKKAATHGGTIVLITDEESIGAYGDVPSYYMEGFVYGTKPLEEGTNVVEDKDKKPAVKK
jgi:hypothetical protein